MKITKGYELTPEQIERHQGLIWFLRRAEIRGDLNSLQHSETAGQVDHWLEQAERKSYEYR